MAFEPTIFDEPHHQALEALAAQALAQRDFPLAYKLSDRRCRISPLLKPHCYVLRGIAAYHLGQKADAISDLTRALELAPEDVAANRWLLAWGNNRQRYGAASALLAVECDFDVLRRAIAVLRAKGRHDFAHVKVMNQTIEGWAAWNGPASAEVQIADGVSICRTPIEPDPTHPLSSICRAANFSISRPRSGHTQSVQLSIEGRVFYSWRVGANEYDTTMVPGRAASEAISDGETTIIVPVYADYAATKACLDSLRNELKRGAGCSAIVIDDATPDNRIAKYLARLNCSPEIRILTNSGNLGFIASVNRALDIIPGGDVVLLNSDTIVPSGFIERLAAVARSAPDIGTVTPLSNHSEFTSFPIPNQPNPMPSYEEIHRIDAIAASINSGIVVDIPSGIGLCLYITRTCLNAVGLLSEDFYPGYLEDADFCLRARQRGFRNVCAPSVFIGHAGSRSFTNSKLKLVMRNLSKIERRFRRHSLECAAFMSADPLQPFREAIERLLPTRQDSPRLLVTGPGVLGAVARERARQLEIERHSVLLLEIRHHADGATIQIIDSIGRTPQSIQCNLSLQREFDWLADYVRQLRPSRIEVLDPTNIPVSFLESILALKIPYDMYIADASLLKPVELPMSPPVHLLEGPSYATNHLFPRSETHENTLKRWRRLAQNADGILVPTAEAREFAGRFLPEQKITTVGKPPLVLRRVVWPARKRAEHQLGIIPVRLCGQEQMLICNIATSLKRSRPDLSVFVMGAMLNDLDLMRQGIFVTGAMDTSELGRAIRSHRVEFLFLGLAQPLFGHPLISCVFNSAIPTAYIDWSKGAIEPRKMDLPIDPTASIAETITELGNWIS
jgi:GT2 family glycosyltransferase